MLTERQPGTRPAQKVAGSYGYQWYLGVMPSGAFQGAEWFAGIGWGGQRLFVVPRLDLVVVMNFGNYYLPSLEQSGIGNTLILQAVLPAVA